MNALTKLWLSFALLSWTRQAIWIKLTKICRLLRKPKSLFFNLSCPSPPLIKSTSLIYAFESAFATSAALLSHTKPRFKNLILGFHWFEKDSNFFSSSTISEEEWSACRVISTISTVSWPVGRSRELKRRGGCLLRWPTMCCSLLWDSRCSSLIFVWCPNFERTHHRSNDVGLPFFFRPLQCFLFSPCPHESLHHRCLFSLLASTGCVYHCRSILFGAFRSLLRTFWEKIVKFTHLKALPST